MNIKFYCFFITVALGCFALQSCSYFKKIDVGYLALSDKLTVEDSLAFAWLDSSGNLNARIIHAGQLHKKSIRWDVLWLHVPDSAQYIDILENKGLQEQLSGYIESGGCLLFSDYAAFLPYEIGIESEQPELRTQGIEDNWLFDKKGFQSFRGHPVFKGLFGGAFIWDGYDDHRLPAIGFYESSYPTQGKVVAVEKSYITVHGSNKLVIEYETGPGKMLAIGGFIYFREKNQLDLKMKKFLSNCLIYLGRNSDMDEKVSYWKRYDNQPKSFEIATARVNFGEDRKPDSGDSSGLFIAVKYPGLNFYDLAGRRVLIMGKEKAGIDELWIHPFRVLRDYQAGIKMNDTVAWLKDLPVKIQIRPESLTRIYQIPSGVLREIIYPSLEKPAAVVSYTCNSNKDVALVIKYRSDLRWMWPYDEKAVGDVWYGYDSLLNAWHLKDSNQDFYCIIGGDLSLIQKCAGQFEDIYFENEIFKGIPTQQNQVYVATEYRLKADNSEPFHLVIAGTNQGMAKTLTHYKSVLKSPLDVYNRMAIHYKNLIDKSLTIESPDKEFNRLWKWAIVGTDRFLAYTYPLGTALLAGFSTTDRGWDGRHKISGRPGYAWYFGRDSEWCGFAINGYGDFDLVKKQLQFLQKFQDLSGKIFHEISTSGVVHFDAADATPLYIILAADYLRASGDLNFIRQSWQQIKRAMDFLYSTDTDGDKLIENTNVGHGWVEGGKLWGAHTTLYLAALWSQALSDAAYLAKKVWKIELSDRYKKDALHIKEIINRDFWNDSTRFFNYGKMSNNSYNPEKTALPAVAMCFNLLDPKKVHYMLESYASAAFSPDWGVRILSWESPLYNPHGYHYGSVWPLFTGWTALAEFTYGNSVQGFTHMMNNIHIKNHWAQGFVEEVINGETYIPTGVCPHQCWSETNILHPGIFGMVGWKPDAPQNSAVLTPKFPINWDSVTVKNLRLGRSVFDMEMKRSPLSTTFDFVLVEGSPFTLHLAPQFLEGCKILDVSVDNQNVAVLSKTMVKILSDTISIPIQMDHRVSYGHKGGIGVVPIIPRPEAGDKTVSAKIINTNFNYPDYQVMLEGRSGTNTTVEIITNFRQIIDLEGAKFLRKELNGPLSLSVKFPYSSEKKYVRKLIKLRVI